VDFGLIILLVGGCSRGLTAEEVRELVREEMTTVAQGNEVTGSPTSSPTSAPATTLQPGEVIALVRGFLISREINTFNCDELYGKRLEKTHVQYFGGVGQEWKVFFKTKTNGEGQEWRVFDDSHLVRSLNDHC